MGAFKGINPKNVLEGESKNNLKYLIKRLDEFKQIDSTISADRVREIGANLPQTR
ncbi:MAG: hypothetical protein ACI9E9_000677 [Reinekea sp.]|jgi:hypothetical protein